LDSILKIVILLVHVFINTVSIVQWMPITDTSKQNSHYAYCCTAET